MSLDAARGLLACPACAGALEADARVASCLQGHRFDIARQGHLNLLGGPQPAHADTSAMVDARARVLASGAFEAVDAALSHHAGGAHTLLDVGGGTGHHLARLLDGLPGARGVCIDISTAAARRAARAHPLAASVVADAWAGLPVRSQRFDLVTCVFAPRNMAEFARVLRPGGLLLVVTPDADHLASVRERHGLLRIDPDKDARLQKAASGHFRAVARRRVRTPLDADASLVRDLIAMGPNAFHGAPGEVGGLRTEVCVSLWLFRPASPALL